MKLTKEQIEKLNTMIGSRGFPLNTIVPIGRKIIMKGDEVVAVGDGELQGMVDEVTKVEPIIIVDKPVVINAEPMIIKPVKKKKRLGLI